MKVSTRVFALFVSGSLMLGSVQAQSDPAAAESETPDTTVAGPQTDAPPGTTHGQPPEQNKPVVVPRSPEELEQLVAPIALYPDSLLAQILAAATYPAEVVEADRWMHEHTDLDADVLAQRVDAQSWDLSVKALTQLPSVLTTMDTDLMWTSSLGDAYSSGPEAVFDAIQVMRRRAQEAGNLQTTPQENVTTDGQTIVIEPTDPDLVYLPEYDPWYAYGDPLAVYPGWVDAPDAYLDGPGIAFGLGVGIGVFAGYGWGWDHWRRDWHRHDHDRFISHGRALAGNDHFGHDHTFGARPGASAPGGFPRGGEPLHDGGLAHRGGLAHEPGFPHEGGFSHEAGFPHPGGGGGSHAGGLVGSLPSGVHPGVAGGFNHGGITGVTPGHASMGAGSQGPGGSHAAGGLPAGGGFHAGGGHR
ncbi:MAG: hypothetical protein JWM63_4512 [Gammaproteobacteria bacterium]|nr:hypothetical protein [Gammaproteobacteria bacterium]